MEVKILKLDNLARGIAYIDNKICFIENTLPNEVVDIEIIKDKSKYLEGRVINYIETSPFRIDEECPYSSICGGCNLNHMCYNDENKYKTKKVKEIVEKYASLDSSIVENIVYNDRNYYRNKLTLHGEDNELGLYKKGSNDIIPIKECLLVNPKINEIITILNNINNGIKEVIIKTSNDNSKIMISIEGEVNKIDELLNISDVLILNGKYLSNNKSILTTIGNKKYHESINSFFQVNNTLTKELYNEVLENVKDKNYNKVLDLYCGTGTIGIYIKDYVEKVIGIDYNESNIKDAKENVKLNNLDNIEFICDKVENKIEEFTDIDLVIVDPPRAGLDEKTRSYLKKINSETIIYVSCDPITLSRDIKDLSDNYKVKYIKPFNMFPRTYHCESITVLERKNVEK